MSNTTPLSYRIDTKLKNEAETILNELGISPTSAIQMFYKQVIINNGIPFDVNLKYRKPLFLSNMSDEELYNELEKGLKDVEEGRVYSQKEVDKILKKELGI